MAAERKEMEYQYSPSRWSKRLPADVVVDAHISVTVAGTKVARESVECELGIEYLTPGGPLMDIYHPSSKTGSLSDVAYVYIHGGYWIDMGVENSGAAAISLTKHGATVVAVGYNLAPKVNMTTIVEQCRKAILYVCERLQDKRIFIAGHSAGGHLAGTLMTTDWNQYGMETAPFCGSILFGGLFDLTPLLNTYINDPLKLTAEEVNKCSPLRQGDKLKRLPAGFQCLIINGEEVSPEYKRQSREFNQLLVTHGIEPTYRVITGMDHFELTEKLDDEEFIITQMIMTFMSI